MYSQLIFSQCLNKCSVQLTVKQQNRYMTQSTCAVSKSKGYKNNEAVQAIVIFNFLHNLILSLQLHKKYPSRHIKNRIQYASLFQSKCSFCTHKQTNTLYPLPLQTCTCTQDHVHWISRVGKDHHNKRIITETIMYKFARHSLPKTYPTATLSHKKRYGYLLCRSRINSFCLCSSR